MKKCEFKLFLTIEGVDGKYINNVLLGNFSDLKDAKRLQKLTKDIYQEIQRAK